MSVVQAMVVPDELKLAPRILLGPGPSEVHPRVLRAMSAPVIGHLDPQFLEVMNQTQEMLRTVFRTKNALTFPVSGTGSAGMEACLVNLIEPGDAVVVCINGVFGTRMADIARRVGGIVTTLERPWGEVFDVDTIRSALFRFRPKLLAIVHGETSTGAWQDLTWVGDLCRAHDVLLVVDAVTSLAGVPLETDGWGIDAIYSGTQKCIGVPPGLAPVSFGPRAVAALERRRHPVLSWYLDVSLVKRYWGSERFYHHTAPITMIYALHEGLRLILEEGLENRWARHLRNHRALKAGLRVLGIGYLPGEGHQLASLNAIVIPSGVDDGTVRSRLLRDYGIEIGGGLGDLKGKVWRAGLMGNGSQASNVLLFLTALEQCLLEQKARIAPGAAVAAANQSYGT
jgi:alanine-glyoxylate transaminase/serine-glyoxylate transaminase/serine-pyruvate transaminase